MNRSSEERRLEFETFRQFQKLSRQYMKWQDDHRDSIMAGSPRTLPHEADSSKLNTLNNYIRRIRAIFRPPTPEPDLPVTPTPVTVGTQTWPTTTFQPLKFINCMYKDSYVPTENKAGSNANTAMKAVPVARNFKPKHGKNKKVVRKHRSKRLYRKKIKWAKSVRFNVVSKKGRYDKATVKRSVKPVLNSKPSAPFQ
ncbi:hypothetical protein PYW08_000589 [Mythimna loreyi]|uniref:Uncharacterized protein n=1 Tax=Mythimna loreyi TaxID=667449 RepID=A0ACC2RCU8_9NEOP|nr:hypothetical protein PYW08_000589 [Mythimna loreyi]